MILITGLDGSGKSSLLDKLEEALSPAVPILRVPTIDVDKFQDNEKLWKTCKFINKLGHQADVEQQPSLKITAMFGSMVLFSKLCEHLKDLGKKDIICERHPLVDTAVYGSAYVTLMHPKSLNLETTQELEQMHAMELEFIINSIGRDIPRTENGQFYDLMTFLFNLFSNKSVSLESQLMDIFKVGKPDHVYFLDAPTGVLLERLDKRQIREHHESEKSLSRMKPLYKDIFESLNLNYTLIDTVGWHHVDQLTKFLIKFYR